MATALPVLEIGLVLLVAAIIGVGARRAGLPAVVGYLAVGLLVGPFTPGYVVDREQIEILADVGVALLLFEVGIELDLRSLAREPRGILVAVPLQVLLIWALGAAVALSLGSAPFGAVTIGLVAALSSSVVAVNISRSRKRTTDADTERALVVWAILQDAVTLVAATILAVLLAPGGDSPVTALARALAFVLFAAAVQGWGVPRLLAAVKDQPDSFLIVAVSAALATAGIGAVAFGIPVALAAFVAGTLFGIRPIAREARREVLPFRDLFAVLFFVAIGTLVDPAAVAREPGWLLVFVALVAAKGALIALLATVFGVPARRAQLGVGLAQIGEFSFVVLGLGVSAGVVSSGQASAALAAAALTIAASAVGARLFPRRASARA
ncbi:MAG TPA: cation:proton antiporter [Candidatus Limnocylindria bacterium]|nr:cation:proton antiporter [Candidatus Limnocylindria bacterium]